MSEESKKLAWEFGRELWQNEYAQDPGPYENPNKTNMIDIFKIFIENYKSDRKNLN